MTMCSAVRRIAIPALLFVPLAQLPAGCGAPSRTAATAEAGARTVVLTGAQVEVVQAGVKTMIANPDTAEFARMTALALPPQPGVHVCGHVKYRKDAGGDGQMQAFYVELREAEGKPVAERGQVGSNPAALSKVTFMCRRHGGG